MLTYFTFIFLDTESGEFFTPPSSPIGQRSALSSEDDLGMESPDEGPDVYIGGSVYGFVVAILDIIVNWSEN